MPATRRRAVLVLVGVLVLVAVVLGGLAVAGGGPAAAPSALPEPPTHRHEGLPVALAVVALAGSASLLVRTLLAEAEPGARAGPGPHGRRW